jgi:hypothetical protein
MKLIIIYGPPASGKLTVAELVSEQTGIPLFHNHLTRDIVRDIYKDKLQDNYGLVDTLRFNVLDYCSSNDTDLLFTYVYEGSEDDTNVKSFMEIVEGNGGEVIFVQLTANRNELLDRVGNESRRRYKKLHDPEILKSLTEDMTKFTIPFVDALTINTSEVSAADAAALIVRTFDLPV